MIATFAELLFRWHKTIDRPMPWKGIKDPYKIWLSEVILQQTRVNQGWEYYNNFIKNYPTIIDLAKAKEDEVLKLWEGLGYYSRARNLHKTAKIVSEDYQGNFPKTYKEIIALPGIGSYTAAAIASFAYDLPYAVLDGNVTRVMSRIENDNTPIDLSPSKKHFQAIIDKHFDKENPALFNQAIMDFGAIHCKPKVPNCVECNMTSICKAFQQKTQEELPIKSKKKKTKKRFLNYLVFENENGEVLFEKRTAKDIWLHLYQFPLIESKVILTFDEVKNHLNQDEINYQKIIPYSKTFKHKLTHQDIEIQFVKVCVADICSIQKKYGGEIEKIQKHNFALPKVISLYLKERQTTLNL